MLNILHDFDPSHSINLESLCLQKTIAKFFTQAWPLLLIEEFILPNCDINEECITGKCETLQFFVEYDLIESAVDSFIFNYESDIDLSHIDSLDDLRQDDTLFNEFLIFIEYSYKITKYSISSPLFNSDDKEIKEFARYFPHYLSQHLNLSSAVFMHENFIFNNENREGRYEFAVDTSDEGGNFSENFNSSREDNYLLALEKGLKSIKSKATN